MAAAATARRWLSLPLLVGPAAIFALAAPAVAEDALWTLDCRSDHHSDALALRQFGDDAWSQLTPRPGRNLTYIDDEIRISRQQSAWTWSLLVRSQAALVTNQPTLALAAQLAKSLQATPDSQWQTQVKLRSFAGAGIAVGRIATIRSGWRASWEVQALGLKHWRDRDINGPVVYRSPSYQFDVVSNQIDDRLDFPFRQNFAPLGYGLLLAGHVSWEGDQAWFEGGLQDGGWLRWRNIPQQQAQLNTATQAVDADGFLIYKPVIQGRNSQDGPQQRRLHWRSTWSAGVKLAGNQRLGLELQTIPGFGALPALSWRQAPAAADSLAWSTAWQFHERRLTVTGAWRGLQLRVGADRLDAKARSRTLALGYSHSF
jgi:hypothetical protein